MAIVKSPCIDVCMLDPVTSLCAGCGRHIDEIGLWSSYDDAERERIMKLLPERLEEITERAAAREAG